MDIESTSFLQATYAVGQGVVAATLVILVGYVLSGTTLFGPDTAVGLRRLARSILLPSLTIAILGSTLALRTLHLYWPILLVSVVSHLTSILVSYVVFHRLFGLPGWIVSASSFNSITSFPLLVFAALGLVPQLLDHLAIDEIDLTEALVKRGTTYILVYAVLSETFRAVLKPIVKRSVKTPAAIKLDGDEGESAHVVEEESASAVSASAASDERTPLLVAAPNAPVAHVKPAHWTDRLNPLILAGLVSLAIALIPGVQNFLFGRLADSGSGRSAGWVGATLGTVLAWLGGTYAIVELLGAGGELRFRDKHGEQEKTLGAVLSITFWRFVAVPAVGITAVWGLSHLPASVYLQDPVLNFALVLVLTTPPVLHIVTTTTTYETITHLSVYLLTPFLAPFALAASLVVFGDGVVFHNDVDLKKALKSAAGGGIAGALAMVIQVLTLMPLRTIMNYQYRFGGTLRNASSTLWADGKVPRLYAGLAAALFQGPLSRFGDTAANAGIIALLESVDLPVLVKTVFASAASATFRMTLTPIDALKTTQQTQGGVKGLRLLKDRIKEQGVASLWYGAIATAAATFVGHYPWFATYNLLSQYLPPGHVLVTKLLRQAVIGFAASVVSDTSSNSLRVLKTYRQTHEGDVGYVAAAKEIIANDGVIGLFGRGLRTRILTNGLQGLLFSVLWKLFADLIAGKDKGHGV